MNIMGALYYSTSPPNSFSSAARRKLILIIICCFTLFVSTALSSGTLVPELPGYPGPLPFILQTGYTSVGDVEFFYYFIESESNPRADPVLLYLNGGPGCSSINGFFYQAGPLKFNITDYVGELPTLIYENNAWSKTANMLFLDAPVGAGFSYAKTSAAYYTSDTLNAQQVHLFLRKWLSDHPMFLLNRVFLGSDSYAGIIVPMVATNIINGNEAGAKPHIRLEGYVMGCAHTNTILEMNSRIPYAHRLTLISDSLYKAAKKSCNGNYATSKSPNCTLDLAAINQCIKLINEQHVLQPNCAFLKPESNSSNQEKEHTRTLQQIPSSLYHLPAHLWCKNMEYLLSDFWLGNPDVQAALHVRQGTKEEVFRCNATLQGYIEDVNDVVPYHKNLTSYRLQTLVYIGDHDMIFPHIAMEAWIKSLNLSIDVDWRPWYVEGQVAGYTRKYTNTGYRLTYATVKGAGHSPTEFKRKECFNMFNRWVHYYPL